MSGVMHLQQRLLELRERERLAKEHNRQLIQQFEEAQDTLRKMLERTAAMKLLQNEYQRYYQSSTHLDYQLKHRTQAGQENRFGEFLNTQKKNLEDQGASNAQLLPLQDLGKMPRKTRTYQESDSPFELQTQVQTQTTAFPKGPSNQPWDIAKSSPLFLHSNLSQPKHHPFTLGQQLPYTASSYLSGPNGQLYTDQALPLSAQEKETVPRRPPSSKSDRSEDSNSHLQELDVKPVRLSSGQAESKSSSRTSSQKSTDKRKRRVWKSDHSSDGDQNSSHESSQSSAVHTCLNAKAINSVDEDSEKSISQISKKSSQLDLKLTKNESENSLADHNKDSETDVESESDEGSQSQQEEQPGSTKLENTKLQETELSISDQSSQEDSVGDLEKGQSDYEGKESSQEDGEDHQHQEDIPQCTSSEEDTDSETDEAESQEEVDQEDVEESGLSDSEEDEDNMEDVKESKKEQDQSKNTSHKTEDSDSEDGIIAPAPQTRSKIIYVIPEHPAVQDEEEVSDSKTSSDDDQTSNDDSEDDDIENLLTPQQQTQKEEPKADDKPKAASDTVIRVRQAGQTDHHIESDEFDDFYD